MLRNLVTSLFQHERVNTTLAKAKEARPIAERLITRARRGDLAARRYISAFVQSEEVAKKLMQDIAPRFATRPGGYTRIYRLGPRIGDSGQMGILELVERKLVAETEKKGDKKGGAKKAGRKKAKEVEVEVTAGGKGKKATKAEKATKAKKAEKEEKAEKKERAAKPGGPAPKKATRKPTTKSAAHEKHTQATRKTGGRERGSREA
jgi:large subunit ribosomal protein L17